MSLRWGIVGTSKISHDFCIAISQESVNYKHEIVAIASQTTGRAEKLAKQFGIQNIWTDYRKLAIDDQVEVVFIGVLNAFHYETCKLMIEFGKHVLCARPMGMNLEQVKEILAMARNHRVFVIEGLCPRFFPAYRYVLRLRNMNVLTDIKEVHVKHGYNATGVERIMKKEMDGGILSDIGVDAIQFVCLIYQEPPITVTSSGKVNSEGIDLHFEAKLTFSDDRRATIICSGLNNIGSQATVMSKRGLICIPDYHCPTKVYGYHGLLEWPLIETGVPVNVMDAMGLRYQADEVMKCIRSGKLESDVLSAREMLLITQLRDQIKKQIGVQYQCDKRVGNPMQN